MHSFGLIVAVLLGSGFVAGFFDSMVGGGGVITLPTLLWAGLSPYLALGTNKLAGSFASSISSFTFFRSGHLHMRLLAWMVPFTFIGAVVGANTVLSVNQRYLKFVILAVIVVIALLTLARKNMGRENQFPGISTRTIFLGILTGFGLGFYDGFVGPGTGSFLLFAMVSLFRFDFLSAAGNGRVLNFTSNIAALLLFLIRGKVVALLGIVMGLGMMAGARVGSRLAVRKGVTLVRRLYIIVALVLAINMAISVI